MEKRKRKSFPDLDGIGKIPPQEIPLEEAVLGSLLIDKEAYEKVESILKPASFYKETNGIIYEAIQTLIKDKHPCDILTVTATLKTAGKLDLVGGAYYIEQLTNRVASSANVEYHARVIAEKYLAREIIRISIEYQRTAFDGEEDVFDMIASMKKELDDLENSVGEEQSESFSKSLQDEVKQKKLDVKAGIKINGLSTGNEELDEKIGGFENSCVYILGAKSGMGKSCRAMIFGKKVAEAGKRVAIFSVEMSQKNYVRRFIVESSSVLMNRYKNNQLDSYDLEKIDFAVSNLMRLPIHIFDSPYCTPNKIRKQTKGLIKRFGAVDFIILDYLQITKSDDKAGSREAEVANVSRELKSIAKEFDIPVLALVQLNKDAVKDFGNKAQRPKTYHIRESNAIEFDADCIMFLYRPFAYFNYGDFPLEEVKQKDGTVKVIGDEYAPYNITEQDYELISELLIAKQRDGSTNMKVKEKFFGHFQRFTAENEYKKEDDPFLTQESENIDIPF